MLLWDGTTTEGWRGAYSENFPAKGWTIKEGVLSVEASDGGESTNGRDIVTDKLFKAFEIPVAFLVWAIGLSLGGTTGYAIKPARDLGPCIMHAVLPIDNKGKTDWTYTWIPVIGPILGSIIAACLYLLLY